MSKSPTFLVAVAPSNRNVGLKCKLVPANSWVAENCVPFHKLFKFIKSSCDGGQDAQEEDMDDLNDLNDREMFDLHIPTPWSWLWRRAWWRPWARPCSSHQRTRYQSHPCQGPGPPELRNWSVDFNLMYFVADSPYRASQTVLLRGETCWPAKYKLSFVSANYDHHYCNFFSNYSLSSSLSAQFYKSVLWSLPGKEVR